MGALRNVLHSSIRFFKTFSHRTSYPCVSPAAQSGSTRGKTTGDVAEKDGAASSALISEQEAAARAARVAERKRRKEEAEAAAAAAADVDFDPKTPSDKRHASLASLLGLLKRRPPPSQAEAAASRAAAQRGEGFLSSESEARLEELRRTVLDTAGPALEVEASGVPGGAADEDDAEVVAALPPVDDDQALLDALKGLPWCAVQRYLMRVSAGCACVFVASVIEPDSALSVSYCGVRRNREFIIRKVRAGFF